MQIDYVIHDDFSMTKVNTLWPSDTIEWQIWVNTGSGNGMLPYDTKPLPEPMLTNHQYNPETFIWEKFH